MPTRPDPKVQPLSTNEQADGGYTHCLVLEPADFADTTTADEDKTITIFTAMAGDVIEKSKLGPGDLHVKSSRFILRQWAVNTEPPNRGIKKWICQARFTLFGGMISSPS